LGTVHHRAVKLVIAAPVLLEEDDVEARGKPEFRLVLVEPDLGGIGFLARFEPLDVVRFAEDDVDPAAVRLPAGQGRLSSVIVIGVIDPEVMLDPEFVLLRSRGRVPLFPEGGDEEVAFTVGPELFKDLFLQRRDDVDDFLFQPFFVRRRKGLLLRALDEGRESRSGEIGEQPKTKERARDSYLYLLYYLSRQEISRNGLFR
jgi:hypothetical protein